MCRVPQGPKPCELPSVPRIAAGMVKGLITKAGSPSGIRTLVGRASPYSLLRHPFGALAGFLIEGQVVSSALREGGVCQELSVTARLAQALIQTKQVVELQKVAGSCGLLSVPFKDSVHYDL